MSSPPENGKAELFDPPERPRLVALSELAPRWDGTGLIVSADPISLGAVFARARKRLVLYVAFGITVILLLHWAKQRWLYLIGISKSKLFGLSVAQAVGFGIIALIGGMLYHFATDAGLLSNATATAAIQEAHLGNFIPKVSRRKLERWLKDDTAVVDTRLAEDYEKGHINGAISIPVNATEEELQKATKAISGQSRIVLYCQSSRCPFAERVAIKLLKGGFSNISIFKGGWAEWTANINQDRKAGL
jgi:rhodanese-related sulfurtransferase